MRQTRRAILLGAVVGMLGAVLSATPLGLRLEEELGLHWLFTMRGPIDPPREVAVVTLEEDTARLAAALPQRSEIQGCVDRALARPLRRWPRCFHTHLIDTLARNGAALIVIDVAFEVPDLPEDDAAMTAAIREAGNVVLFERLAVETPAGGIVKETLVSPIEPLRDAAAGLGPFPLPKVPARVSEFWAFRHAAGDVPTLPVVALHVLARPVLGDLVGLVVGKSSSQLEAGSAQGLRDLIRALRRQARADPALRHRLLAAAKASGRDEAADVHLAALLRVHAGADAYTLNFYGPPGTIRTVRAAELLDGDARGAASELADAVVFVGMSRVSSAEQPDGFYTVYSTDQGVDLSGVEILASAFANLLTNKAVERASYAMTFGLVVALGVIAGSCAYLLSGWGAAFACMSIAIAYFAGAQMLFQSQELWLPLVVPLLIQIPIALLLGLLFQYLTARGAWSRVDRAIRLYVPDGVASILAQGAGPETGTREVFGTYLATDAERYSSVSQRLQPLALRSHINEYFDLLVGTVKRRGADLVTPHADSMLCLWEAAEHDASAAQRACQAALDILDAIEAFNRRFPDRALRTRIGVHEGTAAVGNVGGGGRFTFSLTGDAVNTACRLETLNKALGTRILVSDGIAGKGQGFVFRPVGSFVLYGRSSPLPVSELLGPAGDFELETRDLRARFANALDHFADARWAEAMTAFEEIRTRYPGDGPTQFYRELVPRYASSPSLAGPGGAIHMHEK